MDGKEFYPGIIGMNNLGKTDYATSIIYLLNCIKPIRRYFLLNSVFNEDILKHFSLLLKKIWNPFNFKGVINPH
jgi:U4/U6.U5 tri-snRNP-associated protein 2